MIDSSSFLLVHDLGLGKTVTTIAAAEDLMDHGEIDCALVLCPASIKWQWYKQVHKFADAGKSGKGPLVKVIEGTPSQRQAQYRGVKRGDYEYVIMNYEQVVIDWDIVRLLEFDCIICDEIVAIKNFKTKRSRHVKRLDAPFKWGLTGQPIENRPEELFSIMQWIDPNLLGDFRIFDRAFIERDQWGNPKKYCNLRTLHGRIKSVVDRKTRSQVKDQMPKIVREDYIVDFDPKAWRLYRHIARELIGVIREMPHYQTFDLIDHYVGSEDKRAQGEIMTRLMALRMLCDHPRLLDYSADWYDDPFTQAGSRYINGLRRAKTFDVLKETPKLDATIDLITQILEANSKNKIVLFSFFKPMLAPLIADRLRWDHELFTGDLSLQDREKGKERFLTDPGCRILLSSDAGGIGVDIPVANYLISYDLPFSAGKLHQREGRIDRISSVWPQITLISMLMRDSIEERMLDMLEQKMAIASAWMDGKGLDKSGSLELTLGSLVGFLEETARSVA
jgi:SNF2 family DNA or RNA helicase